LRSELRSSERAHIAPYPAIALDAIAFFVFQTFPIPKKQMGAEDSPSTPALLIVSSFLCE
jgi:hypothetical protein